MTPADGGRLRHNGLGPAPPERPGPAAPKRDAPGGRDQWVREMASLTISFSRFNRANRA